MLTYEDLTKAGKTDADRIEFVKKAITEHINSPEYQKAVEAQAYYDGENPTITRYEKILYDMQGRAHVDMWTANHKISSQFFSTAVNQEVAYLLGNGIRFSNDATKKKLGKKFDARVLQSELNARIHGVSFGFWNYDHLECFSFLQFMPLLGEENGAVMSGIRHWQLADDKPLRATLYELDGYTELMQRKGEEMVIIKEKQPYKTTRKGTKAEGMEIVNGSNYDGFPIVPLYSNEQHKSAICGKRNTIDALDLVTSQMVNNVDEGNLIYWVLTNCGGMDDLDDAKFIERIKTTHVAHADGDAGATAEAHSIDAPIDGTIASADKLESKLYKDFQAFNPESVTAGNQSATAIHACYIPLDLKCDIVIEPQVTEFIYGILALAGIDDEPTYQRNQIINKMEETQTLVMQADYLDDEYITKKILSINGDIDQYEDMVKRKDAEAADRLKKAEKRLRQFEENKVVESEEEDNEADNAN